MKRSKKEFETNEGSSYHHGNLRTALLDRAELLVDTHPENDLSIRQLAADIGVSSTAPKAHFKSKSDLLHALAARGFSYLRDKTTEAIQGSWDDPLEHTQQLALGYLRFSREHPGLYRVMFSIGLDHDGDADLQKASSDAYSVLRDSVDKVFPDANADETEKRVLAAWALVHGFATLMNNGPFASTIRTDTNLDALAEITAASVVGWATAKAR